MTREEKIIEALRAAFSDAMEEPDIGAAYAEILTNIWQSAEQAPEWAVRNKHKQASFLEELRTHYNVVNSEGLVWCPIVKDYAVGTRTAAHIVPHSLGLANIGYLFGDPDEGYNYLWSMENGMIMHSTLESQFDKGDFIIIPMSVAPASEPKPTAPPNLGASGSSTTAPKIPPRTHSLPYHQRTSSKKGHETGRSLIGPHKVGGSGPTYNSLDGSELEFKNDRRPGKRYLYYHYISTILRYVRYEKPDWAQYRVEIPSGKLWATPGPYIRRSILKKLANAIGDTELDEGLTQSTTFEGHDNKSEAEEDVISNEVYLSKEVPLLKEKGEWDEEDEEDEDDGDD
ncbi:MAG: hypothetical protein M1812_005058 [Candelaria pacifica]|nr:MAG: hypothetical protein M1812_005058 [Candelaria pacifica]